MKVLNGIELLKKTYDKLLSDVAKEYGLTLNELKILLFLEKHESNVSRDIVAGIKATKSHVSLSVCSLEQKGYIVKKPDEMDKKKNHLSITNKAFSVIESGKAVQNKIKKIMCEDISKDELKLLNDIAKKIKKNLEKYNQN